MIAGRRFSQRFLLIGVVMLAPLMFFAWTYVTQQAQNQIQFHEQERMGIRYIRPVTALLSEIVAARAGSVADFDDEVAAVATVDARYGAALGTSASWDGWTRTLGAARTGGAPSSQQYNHLAQKLIDLVTHVANTSNLILDPDLDSYYLMDIIVVRQPLLLDQVGQVVHLAPNSGAAAANHDELVIARAIITSTAAAIATDVATSVDSTQDPELQADDGDDGEQAVA